MGLTIGQCELLSSSVSSLVVSTCAKQARFSHLSSIGQVNDTNCEKAEQRHFFQYGHVVKRDKEIRWPFL